MRAWSNHCRNISEGIINFEFTEDFQLYALSEACGLSIEDKREYWMITLPWLSQRPYGKACVLLCKKSLQGNAYTYGEWMQTSGANFIVMVPHFLNTRLHNLSGLPVSIKMGKDIYGFKTIVWNSEHVSKLKTAKIFFFFN